MDAIHDSDKPYTLPSAAAIAERCEGRAWDDAVHDADRLLLEQASDAIRILMNRCVELAAVIERSEAREAAR